MQGVIYGLQPRTQWLIVLVSMTLLVIVLNMVRKRQLREQYSLLWIAACAVLLLSAVLIRAVDALAHAVGIFYPPAFVFLVAILLIVVLQVHFSVVISSLKEQSRTLAQDLGILEDQVRSLRRQIGDNGESPPPGNPMEREKIRKAATSTTL
ncbi:MAG TPA: DUF2304 domain-containing protein [Thermoanaerobaculia bacterium]